MKTAHDAEHLRIVLESMQPVRSEHAFGQTCAWRIANDKRSILVGGRDKEAAARRLLDAWLNTGEPFAFVKGDDA